MPRARKSIAKKRAARSTASQVRTGRGRKSSSQKDLLARARGYLKNLGPKVVPSLAVLKGYKSSRGFYIGLVVAGLFLLLLYKRDLFIAASVNGVPISNIELLSRLNDQYRSQTLNQMVNEKIILEEARKRGVAVSEPEILNRIAELERQVGGAGTLDNLLAQQGQSRNSLKNQLRVQLAVEKIFAGEATVSAEEVNKFLEENREALQSTTSAEQTKEAEDVLKQQKTSELFQEKFPKWKEQTKVEIY